MKKINIYLLTLMSLCMLGWTACTDSVVYEPASILEGQGAYFPAASASYAVKEATGQSALQIFRSNSNGSAEVSLKVEYAEGVSDFVQVPATAAFADGQKEAIVNIGYKGLVEGKAYKLKVSVSDATPYATAAVTVSILYSNEPEYKWEKITSQAIYLDDMFAAISKGGMKTRGITVEKAAGKNIFRFRSPYDNDYFMETWGGTLFPKDFVFNYIVLDGETYKNADGTPLYYIKKMNLGFNMIVSGGKNVTVEKNTEKLMFGSVAVNLKKDGAPIPPTSADFPLGTYDTKKKVFNLGAVFQDVEGYKVLTYEAGKFMLYLDPAALVPDNDKDYKWMPKYNLDGTFTSEQSKEKWAQAIEQAEEDSTFYRLPALYAPDAALYFYFDEKKGTVSVVKGQKSGLKLSDFADKTVYMEGTPGKSSYDAKTRTLTFGLTFYLVDENGKKSAELMKVTEKMELGTGYEALLRNKKPDDYIGKWKVRMAGKEEGTVEANVTKVDKNVLGVTGLSGTGKMDMVYLSYDAESGLLNFQAQRVDSLSSLVGNQRVLVVPFLSTAGKLSGTDQLMGGLTADGGLKFMDYSGNAGTYDAMCFIVLNDDKVKSLSGNWTMLDWTPLAAQARLASFKVQPGMSKEALKWDVAPRRSYVTELNVTPVPIQPKSELRMEIVVPMDKQEALFE